MRKGRSRRITGVIIALMFVAACMSPPMRAFENLPEKLYLKAGTQAQIDFTLPGTAELSQTSQAVISGFDQSVSQIGNSVKLTAGEGAGEATLTYRLLGIFPIKQVNVTVEAEKVLIPGGQSVGVAILTEGVVVVGSSDLGNTPSPARLAGLRAGDRILEVDGEAVESSGGLQQAVAAGKKVTLLVERAGERAEVEIMPAIDPRDKVYRLGIWVRDSTAGIGTLTFYDPDTGFFGALGHAITDVDTGIVLPVGYGGIYQSSVVDVNKGKRGEPGELLGQFFDADTQIGEIEKNTDFGVFGTTDLPLENALYPAGLPIGTRADIHIGEAEILTTLVDGEIHAYDCEILKLNDQDTANTRSMVLQITDPELLESTGGIVQGMSGSPIIQDGRIVGAVTHVFVNDPTQGYGVYIEWMLGASG